MTLEELKILSNQHKILSLSVDFIIASYDTSHAKNLDTARYILVTATENGLPRRILASEKPKLRLHKPDDTYVYNSCEVIEDGRILVRLTEQIMAYPGTASCDIQIAAADGAVYTTKIFHIVIDIPAYDNSVIESSSEFGELNRLISGEQEHIEAVKNLEKTLTENEEIRNTNEQSRQNSENTRQSNESERAAAEAQRQDNESARALAENARQDSENSRTAAESSRAANEALRQSQETTRQSDTAAAVSEAEAAARKAADAADDLRDKLDSHYFALAEDLISHDTDNAAHNDIRELLSSLTARLNTLADSDDSTLDQLSEIVAYIKNNRELIEIVTTNKVNVSDIVDSLSSSAAGKPLSANQGRLLKQLISTLEETLDLKADSSFKKISVGPASISAASKDDTLTLSAGSNITLTADSANNKITISSSGGGSVTVDSSLNAASVNPVQNKAVYEAFSKYLPLSGGTMKGTAYFGSQSYYINTSGVASMNTVSNPSGALNLLGKSSIHLRSNSGNIVIDASSPGNGHLIFSDTNYSNAFTGEMYIVTLGTASENGRFRLRLGNSISSGTGGNYSGELLIYSPSSYYWYLLGNKTITANHAIYFPNAGGQFVVSANNTAVGSTNTPVYITSNGEVKACGHSFGSYLPLAGGTMTGIINSSSIRPKTAFAHNLGEDYIPWNVVSSRRYRIYGLNNTRYGRFDTEIMGTQSQVGLSLLELGNNIASGTANNAYGRIDIYGLDTYHWVISGSKTAGADRLLKLPKANGQLLVGADETAVGNASVPVYVTSNGEVKRCTTIPTYKKSGTFTISSSNSTVTLFDVHKASSYPFVMVQASMNSSFSPGATMLLALSYPNSMTSVSYISTSSVTLALSQGLYVNAKSVGTGTLYYNIFYFG